MMEIRVKQHHGIEYAYVVSDEVLIREAQDALDLIATVQYDAGCDRIMIQKEAISDEFFRLGSGLAGDVLQKFVNYRVRLAIIGDYSRYTSKPLLDFIHESNQGSHICFAANEQEAADWLCV